MDEQNKLNDSGEGNPVSPNGVKNGGENDLTKKEQVFAGYGLQVRIRTDISEKAIHKLGAKRLGTVHHEDKYFIPRDQSLDDARTLIRIRKGLILPTRLPANPRGQMEVQ